MKKKVFTFLGVSAVLAVFCLNFFLTPKNAFGQVNTNTPGGGSGGAECLVNSTTMSHWAQIASSVQVCASCTWWEIEEDTNGGRRYVEKNANAVATISQCVARRPEDSCTSQYVYSASCPESVDTSQPLDDTGTDTAPPDTGGGPF